MFTSSSVGEVAEKATRRRSRWHRLPYGVPLCIGFLGYLAFLHGL
jgi:prepilin peptidase CpaA